MRVFVKICMNLYLYKLASWPAKFKHYDIFHRNEQHSSQIHQKTKINKIQNKKKKTQNTKIWKIHQSLVDNVGHWIAFWTGSQDQNFVYIMM